MTTMDWSARDGETAGLAAATSVTWASVGSYDVDLHPAYAIGGTKPNGGYVLAMLGRAALDAAAREGATQPHVIAAGAQYSASPDNGPARVVTEVLRIGRTASQVRARLVQGEATTGIEARFTLGTLPDGGRPYWGGLEPVAIPRIETCERPPLPMGPRDNAVLFDPATTIRMSADGPVATGGGELRAWFRYESEEAVPPWALLFVADCLPPATFGVVASGWVPTLDLTAYVRAVPAPGPLRLRFRVQLIQDGLADEVLEAWDSEDRLVLQATQLAALRHPR